MGEPVGLEIAFKGIAVREIDGFKMEIFVLLQDVQSIFFQLY